MSTIAKTIMPVGCSEAVELRGVAARALGLPPGTRHSAYLTLRGEGAPLLEATRIGDVSLSKLSLPSFAAMLPAASANGSEGVVMVLLQTHGSTSYENDRFAGVSKLNALNVFDGFLDTRIASQDSSERVVAIIPKRLFHPLVLNGWGGTMFLNGDVPGLPGIFASFLKSSLLQSQSLNDHHRARLQRLLVHFVQDLMEASADVPETVAATSLARIRAEATRLVDSHLDSLAGVSDLAERINCSERYLYKAFEECGTTPARYLLSARLKRARDRLATSDSRVTISEIAYSCGFQSYSHFSRVFKAAFGISPQACASAIRDGVA